MLLSKLEKTVEGDVFRVSYKQIRRLLKVKGNLGYLAVHQDTITQNP